jgi:hypothetical protein
VRHRATIFARLRSPARAEPLAWVAIFAVLVQMVLGAPLASRMMIDAAWHEAGDAGKALCIAHEGTDEGNASHQIPARGHHDHEHCVLCQASAAPLHLVPAALVVAALVVVALDPPFFYALEKPEACRAHHAEARAPPRR